MVLCARRTGFTVIELLVSVVILAIISTVIIGSLSEFRAKQVVNVTSENIISLLIKARTDTLASKGNSQYGVHFESGKVVLFKGASYTSGDPDNYEITLDTNVTLTGISFSGGTGADVVFKRLTGSTDNTGSVTVIYAGNTSIQRVITVYGTGSIERD